MKKNLIWAALGAMTLLSCQQETDITTPEGKTFTATLESPSTRTALEKNGETYDVLWRSGDRITIVDGTPKNNVGIYTTESTTKQGVFTRTEGKEAEDPVYKAYYPADLYIDGGTVLPAVRDYVPGNITGAPMYAESETASLSFKNLCGLIQLNISSTQAGKRVRKISFQAEQGMSGPFTISDNAAVVSGTGGLTLDCGEDGAAIGEEAVPFFIAVPANTYNSLKITVFTTDGDFQTRTSTEGIGIERSKITRIYLNFGELGAATGSADIIGGTRQPWVQLWPGGPKWARFNIGSTITGYEAVTDYTHPDVTGGYYSYKGITDSAPNANGTDDTATLHWGFNWATPTQEQEQGLLDNCDWTYCDGSNIQYEPGCTIAGWKVSGKEPGYDGLSIFLPLSGIRDQNGRARQNVGSRGVFWSTTSGGSGAYYLHVTNNGREMSSHNQPHGCSVRAVCIADEPYVEGVFVMTAANARIVSYHFNNYAGDNPKLFIREDLTDPITITRADGEIDLEGHAIGKLYLQNNEEGKTVSVKNGTISEGIDGKDGLNDYFCGTVALSDLHVKMIWNDGHPYVINGGTYDEIQLNKNANTPGIVTINNGFFGDIYRYVDRNGKSDDGSAFVLAGGKYKVRPALKWCIAGHYVAANADSDSDTYPYAVIAGDPADAWLNESAAKDLSAEETANTYIYDEPGIYKFKATVKGNGGLDPVTGATATPIDAADISGVTVLWELKEQGRAIRNDDEYYRIAYRNGYVYFEAPEVFVRGDAFVAVFKDGEDSRNGRFDRDKDEILWSWLIWATEQPGKAGHIYTIFMDRNIGAWGTNETFAGGFAYQWGRPCPFSASYNKAYSPYPYYPDRKQAFRFEAVGDGKTPAYSVSHPETFFYGKANWMSSDAMCTTLWADDVKTIYDPSPIGWKVPSKDQLTGITNSINFYGTGFIGNGSKSDFGYGNPGSVLLWSSTCDDTDNYLGAWSNSYGNMTKKYGSWPDADMTSGLPIRCVQESPVGHVDPIPGSANSFLVTKAGTFSFDATVKGNGARDPITGMQATRIDKAQIAGVKVLWEVYGQGRAIKHDGEAYSIRYADGKVTLTTPDVLIPGAACVAVYDSSDRILWSWLIWSTETPGTEVSGSDVFMDRNLGAVYAGNCMRGFLYQWGRKDAFPASDASGHAYDYVPERMTCYSISNTAATVAFTVEQPTTLISKTTWVTADDFRAGLWHDTEKSIYDPCPEGWKVPTAAQMTDYHSHIGIKTLPGTGFIGDCTTDFSYGNSGSGYYWSSTYSDRTRAKAFRNDGRCNQNWPIQEGYAIRCVKERVELPPPDGNTEHYGSGGDSYTDDDFNE